MARAGFLERRQMSSV